MKKSKKKVKALAPTTTERLLKVADRKDKIESEIYALRSKLVELVLKLEPALEELQTVATEIAARVQSEDCPEDEAIPMARRLRDYYTDDMIACTLRHCASSVQANVEYAKEALEKEEAAK